MPLTFTLGQPCTGGDHFDLTMHLDGRSVTAPVSYTELLEPMSEEEVAQFLSSFAHLLVSTHPNVSRATIRNKLANASITVSL